MKTRRRSSESAKYCFFYWCVRSGHTVSSASLALRPKYWPEVLPSSFFKIWFEEDLWMIKKVRFMYFPKSSIHVQLRPFDLTTWVKEVRIAWHSYKQRIALRMSQKLQNHFGISKTSHWPDSESQNVLLLTKCCMEFRSAPDLPFWSLSLSNMLNSLRKATDKWFAEDLPNFVKLAEKSLPPGPGPFMIGGKVSAADLGFYTLLLAPGGFFDNTEGAKASFQDCWKSPKLKSQSSGLG